MKNKIFGITAATIALFSLNLSIADASPTPTPTPRVVISEPLLLDSGNVFTVAEQNEIKSTLKKTFYENGLLVVVTTSQGNSNAGPKSAQVLSQNLGINDINGGKAALISLSKEPKSVFVIQSKKTVDVLTPLALATVMDQFILPDFKAGNYAQGTIKGVTGLGEIFSGKLNLATESDSNVYDEKTLVFYLVGIAAGILIIFLAAQIIFTFKRKKLLKLEKNNQTGDVENDWVE